MHACMHAVGSPRAIPRHTAGDVPACTRRRRAVFCPFRCFTVTQSKMCVSITVLHTSSGSAVIPRGSSSSWFIRGKTGSVFGRSRAVGDAGSRTGRRSVLTRVATWWHWENPQRRSTTTVNLQRRRVGHVGGGGLSHQRRMMDGGWLAGRSVGRSFVCRLLLACTYVQLYSTCIQDVCMHVLHRHRNDRETT